MCIILPVDHIPCTHTVAIWQHCINAIESKRRSLAPCQHIRQHARPILTRKLCINCGGPRFFARRGGIAERGWHTAEAVSERSGEVSGEDSDMGYGSDVIVEEDEDAFDLAISPRGSRATVEARARKEHQTIRSRRSLSSHRSPSRRPSWRPNLKRELMREAFSSNDYDSLDSRTASFSEDTHDEASHTDASARSTSGERSHSPEYTGARNRKPALPPLDTKPCRPTPIRKISTLLHPSTPSDLTPTEEKDVTSLPTAFKCSPILRPSSPSLAVAAESGPSPPTSLSSLNSSPIDITPPVRRGSTLLHPSTPDEPATTDTQPTAFPFSLPTPPSSSHSVKFSPAMLRLPLKPHGKTKPSTEPQGPHSQRALTSEPDFDSTSQYSDPYSNSEAEDQEEAYCVSPISATGPEPDHELCHATPSGTAEESERCRRHGNGTVEKLATMARTARASRVSFHGASWRVLPAEDR